MAIVNQAIVSTIFNFHLAFLEFLNSNNFQVVSVREQRVAEYAFGDAVLVQCDGKHVAGTVMEKVDEVNYEVYVDGCMMRKNVSQISADKVNEKRLNTI